MGVFNYSHKSCPNVPPWKNKRAGPRKATEKAREMNEPPGKLPTTQQREFKPILR